MIPAMPKRMSEGRASRIPTRSQEPPRVTPRAAAAKGLTDDQQLRWHALPNARLPVVTAAAIYFGWVLSGAIVVEVVFDFQGLGKLTWDATRALDFPLMSAIFFIATLGVVVANALADVLYLFLDPRVREA